jgi:hypothetical protein
VIKQQIQSPPPTVLAKLPLSVVSAIWDGLCKPYSLGLTRSNRVRVISIPNTYSALWKTKEYSDFIIIYQLEHTTQETAFSVHKCILSRWEFFNTILMKGEDSIAHKSRIPTTTFKKLLRYFYKGFPKPFSLTDSAWILSFSEYYLLQSEKILLNYCKAVIDVEVREENWMEALELGVELQNTDLQEKALKLAPDGYQPLANKMHRLLLENNNLRKQK